MRDFARSVEIAAPVDVVWSVLSDGERWPEWTPTVSSVKPLRPGPLAVGSMVLIRQPKFRQAISHAFNREQIRKALYYNTGEPTTGTLSPKAIEYLVNDEGLITGFVEKPPPGTAPGNLVNAGVWIFEPGLVDEIPPGAVRVEETLFPSLVARRRKVLGFRFDGPWADLGTPARYLAASRLLLGQRNEIAPGTKLSATCHVTGSAIGENSQLQMGSEVDNSILWENVTIGAGARVVDCILADGVTVGPNAVVISSVVGRGAIIPPGITVPPGTVLDAGARYDGAG